MPPAPRDRDGVSLRLSRPPGRAAVVCAARGRCQRKSLRGRGAGGRLAAPWCPSHRTSVPGRSSPPRLEICSAAVRRADEPVGRSGSSCSGVISACGLERSAGRTGGAVGRGGCSWLVVPARLEMAEKRYWVCAKLPASDEWFCSAVVCNMLLVLLLV